MVDKYLRCASHRSESESESKCKCKRNCKRRSKSQTKTKDLASARKQQELGLRPPQSAGQAPGMAAPVPELATQPAAADWAARNLALSANGSVKERIGPRKLGAALAARPRVEISAASRVGRARQPRGGCSPAAAKRRAPTSLGQVT